jgi:tRNA pseudouridine55 synthase
MTSEEHRDKRAKSTTTVAETASDAPAVPAPAAAAAAAPASAAPKRAPYVKQKKKVHPPPTPVLSPSLPEDLSVWESAVLLIDKPPSWTSFDVCGKLRAQLAGLLRKKAMSIKVGHAGTLDPAATGLLVVCVGRATKQIDSFVAMHKEYSGVLRLGEATPSYDADTEVTERLPWAHVDDAALGGAAAGLTGDLQQLPPMFSAVRMGGKRLYEAAREGREVERQPRAVRVDSFQLERDSEAHQDVRFSIVCGKGTYVRSLVFDLGRAVGSAAHVTALRREAIGAIRVDGAWPMEELVAALEAQRQRLAAAPVAAAAAERPVQPPAEPAAEEAAAAEPAADTEL